MYLINALKQVLGEKCLVTATTGIAPFIINGQTLHSAAQLLIRDHRELQGESLQHLQLKLEGKAYLIVDEMSMIGHKMFSWLDNRLHAGTGNQNKPFVGISVILLGDFGQLPQWVIEHYMFLGMGRSLVIMGIVSIVCLTLLLFLMILCDRLAAILKR